MANQSGTILATCGREVGEAEVEHALEVLRLCPGLSRHELALTLCEHWGWVSATGRLQRRSCVKLLEHLESQGRIRLPQKSTSSATRRARSGAPAWSARTAPRPTIACELAQLQPVRLELVSSRNEMELWTEFVSRHHPLGCTRMMGCTLRYFITSRRGRLGCILMGHAALALAVRDRWLGWSRQERLSRLPWVINNHRLLLFPWVSVSHLMSHVLGQLARRVSADWDARWGYRPVLMETFVDPAHYRGVGYRAAGWQLLGESTGRGMARAHREYRTTPKLVLVRPLAPDFRVHLRTAIPMATTCATAPPNPR